MSDTRIQYDRVMDECRELFLTKNEAYGDSWRIFELSTHIDLMLAKLYRCKELLKHGEQTRNNESVEDNLKDIANYAKLALIKITESKDDPA